MKDKILVIGSANTDMVMSVANFPKPGETVMANDFLQNHGGKGANQAVAVARLGGNTSFIAKVGNDSFGTDTIESLKKENIDVRGVTISHTHPSGTALIMVDAHGENSIIVNAGANGQLCEADIDACESLVAKAGIVLMQLETPVKTLAHAAQMAKKYGAMVVLNPAPAPKEPLPAELLQNVDLLIPNETESQILSGLGDGAAIEACVERIKTLGVQHVVVTMGAKGALVPNGNQLTLIPSFKVTAVDTTAAGDTFCGAVCVALSSGKTLTEAISFANKAASVTVTRKGAQMSIPYLSELK